MSQIITKGMVAAFHYTVHDEDGNLIDKSEDSPMSYLHGYGNIVPGLEKELEGKKSGDSIKVKVSPEGAYGDYNPNLVQNVAKTSFEDMGDLEVGMQFEAESDEGVFIATILKIEGDNVLVDGNHPLAGRTLEFAVTIDSIRTGTREEIEHGHTHDEVDGHHHH